MTAAVIGQVSSAYSPSTSALPPKVSVSKEQWKPPKLSHYQRGIYRGARSRRHRYTIRPTSWLK